VCPPARSRGARARAQGLKVAIIEGHDIGGTCVNRGCVPSKALLAASGRVRELQNTMHLKSMGIQVTSRAHAPWQDACCSGLPPMCSAASEGDALCSGGEVPWPDSALKANLP